MRRNSSSSRRLLDPAVLQRGALEVAELARTERVELALTGGFALYFYGSDRLTGDVDFVASNTLTALPALRLLSFGGVKCESPSGVPTDLIVRSDDVSALYEEALETAVHDDEIGYSLVLPEYIAAMKFYAGRRRDLDDLTFIVTNPETNLAEARRIIRKHLGLYAVKEFDIFVAEAQWLKEREP